MAFKRKVDSAVTPTTAADQSTIVEAASDAKGSVKKAKRANITTVTSSTPTKAGAQGGKVGTESTPKVKTTKSVTKGEVEVEISSNARAPKKQAENKAATKSSKSTKDNDNEKSKETEKEKGKKTGSLKDKTSKVKPKIDAKAKTARVPSMEEFLAGARTLPITIGQKEEDEVKVLAKAKEMSTGSYGWSGSKNAKIPFGDEGGTVDVSISVNIVVQHSKAKSG